MLTPTMFIPMLMTLMSSNRLISFFREGEVLRRLQERRGHGWRRRTRQQAGCDHQHERGSLPEDFQP